MKLTVLAAAFFPDLGPVRYLAQSAERHGLPIRWYGQGRPPSRDWWHVQVRELVAALWQVETSHILYTDACDVIATTNAQEILRRYKALGAPPLLMSWDRPANGGICAGGWMGETQAAINGLRALEDYSNPTADEPQVVWTRVVEDGSVEAAIDHRDAVFCVVAGDGSDGLPKPLPCFLHFAGGYVDPDTGRDWKMQRYWREQGYE